MRLRIMTVATLAVGLWPAPGIKASEQPHNEAARFATTRTVTFSFPCYL
jgi:hypothetical protein